LVVFIAHAIANFQKMWLLAAATLTPIVLPWPAWGIFVFWK
jgi:hypothetical protein